MKFANCCHIAINVDDLDETTARLKEYDVSMVWDAPVRVKQYRSNFTRRDGGVGVVFQLADELAETRESQPFRPEMIEDLAEKP